MSPVWRERSTGIPLPCRRNRRPDCVPSATFTRVLAPARAYGKTLREFDAHVGLDRLAAFHLNDSRKPFGSRVDRHAHIGRGELGTEPFRLLVNDRRFRNRPMILETPKEEGDVDDMDAVNLATLRGLAQK